MNKINIFKKEYKNKNLKELNFVLIALKKAKFSLKIQLTTQKINDTSKLKKIRKNIARIKTFINKRTFK